MKLSDKHNLRASEREEYVEYAFLADLCRYGWANNRFVEVARVNTDNYGYDLVLSCNGITRHVQLKTSHTGSSVRRQNINSALAEKPSGCVIWIRVHPETLNLAEFLWFGNRAGAKLLIHDLKTEKPAYIRNGFGHFNSVLLPWARCTRLDRIADVFRHLFI